MSKLYEQVIQTPKSPRLQHCAFLGSHLWLDKVSHISSLREKKKQNLVNGSIGLVYRFWSSMV